MKAVKYFLRLTYASGKTQNIPCSTRENAVKVFEDTGADTAEWFCTDAEGTWCIGTITRRATR